MTVGGRALVFALAPLLLTVGSCCPLRAEIFPLPFPSAPVEVKRYLAAHFDVMYPSAEPHGSARRAGLFAPRLGLPALLGPDERFDLEVLERSEGAKAPLHAALVAPNRTAGQVDACLRGVPSVGCVPLQAQDERDEPLQAGFVSRVISVAPAVHVEPAAWDLAFRAGDDAVERQPRCVFTYAEPSAKPRALKIVQLSDLHLGKHPNLEEGLVPALKRVVAAVNDEQPDLVIITGDLVENGGDELWLDRVRALLLDLHAPLLIIAGNHDYSHFPKLQHVEIPADGWLQFARRFFAERRTQLSLGGWDFLGIDSGPSVFSTRILTRGVGGDTIAWLHERLDAAHTAGRKVIIYMHAPTRTGPPRNGNPDGPGQFGHIWYGAAQLEEAMQRAADRGTRVLLLSGHAHWLEVHLIQPPSVDPNGRWQRQNDGAFLCQPLRVDVAAAMFNVPAATRVTFHVMDKGLYSGFAVIDTGVSLSTPPTVRFRLFDRKGAPLSCPQDTPAKR